MKYLSLDNPVKLNKKYILMGHIVLQAVGIAESGVLFKVVSRGKASVGGASEGKEVFYHNNDHGFWLGLREYVPPPVKEKVFVIVWYIPSYKGTQVTHGTDAESAYMLVCTYGWIPVKGFEVEYDVPVTGD